MWGKGVEVGGGFEEMEGGDEVGDGVDGEVW